MLKILKLYFQKYILYLNKFFILNIYSSLWRVILSKPRPSNEESDDDVISNFSLSCPFLATPRIFICDDREPFFFFQTLGGT